MTTYVDIKAVRIQQWLDATSRLKGRVGGSGLLASRTGDEHVADMLSRSGVADVEINSMAGQIDGQVSLLLAGDERTSDAGRLAAVLVHDLQLDMPTLGFEAVAGEGASYSEAITGMLEAHAEGRLLFDAPALPPELVVGEPCDECWAQPAQRGRRTCEECDLRLSDQWRRAWRQRFDGWNGVNIAEDFGGAARDTRRRKGTELALIFADGNRIGALIRELSRRQGQEGVPDKADMSRILNDATMSALEAALTSVGGERGGVKALVHLAGGDDLLVTVPADAGWQVTRLFLAGFAEAIAEAAPGLPAEVVPGASAGLLFHHAKGLPFSEAMVRVTRLLKSAKAQFSGARSAIAFGDQTFDGDRLTASGRPAVAIDWLNENRAALDDLSSMPSAQWHSLRDLVTARPDYTPNGDALRKSTGHGHHSLIDLSEDLLASPAGALGDADRFDEFESCARWLLDLVRWTR